MRSRIVAIVPKEPRPSPLEPSPAAGPQPDRTAKSAYRRCFRRAMITTVDDKRPPLGRCWPAISTALHSHGAVPRFRPDPPAGNSGGGRSRSLRQLRCNTVLGRVGGRFRTVPFPAPRVDLLHTPPGCFPPRLTRRLAPRVGRHSERPSRAFHHRANSNLVRLAGAAIQASRSHRLQWRHGFVTRSPKFLWRHLARVKPRRVALMQFETVLHPRPPSGQRRCLTLRFVDRRR